MQTPPQQAEGAALQQVPQRPHLLPLWPLLEPQQPAVERAAASQLREGPQPPAHQPKHDDPRLWTRLAAAQRFHQKPRAHELQQIRQSSRSAQVHANWTRYGGRRLLLQPRGPLANSHFQTHQ